MNPTPPRPQAPIETRLLSDLQSWTPRRWGQAILLALGLHLVLVWFFGQPLALPAPVRLPKATLHFAADSQARHQLDQSLLVQDAALLPMPGLHGFSEEGWLHYEPLPHQWIGWTDARGWLALDPQTLGSDFSQHLARESFPPLPIAERPEPPPVGRLLSVANLDIPNRSRLSVLGPLARESRALIRPPELPSWPHADILTNTVIQVLVDREGWAFSATILVSSGSPQADGWALNQSRMLRFEPDPIPALDQPAAEGNRLTAGRLVFHWHTTPATNVVNSIPKTL